MAKWGNHGLRVPLGSFWAVGLFEDVVTPIIGVEYFMIGEQHATGEQHGRFLTAFVSPNVGRLRGDFSLLKDWGSWMSQVDYLGQGERVARMRCYQIVGEIGLGLLLGKQIETKPLCPQLSRLSQYFLNRFTNA